MEENEANKTDNSSLILKSLFLFTAGGVGLFSGFANALGSARKKDPNSFDKGLIGDVTAAKEAHQRRVLHEAGTKLAEAGSLEEVDSGLNIAQNQEHIPKDSLSVKSR